MGHCAKALTEQPHGEATLDYLEKANLFVTLMGGTTVGIVITISLQT